MQSSWKLIASLVLTLCAFACLSSPARAQVTSGTIQGTVADESGAPIADADVTVTNVGTQFSRTVKTGSDGTFVFRDLPLGSYRVDAKHSGFKNTTQTGIELHVAQTVVLNVALHVGAVSEKVVVEASPIAVETTNGEVSGLVEGNQVRELPMNGRSFTQLLTLMPGVATADSFDPKNKGLLSAVDMSVSGGSSNANLFLVDGGHNNDVGSQRTILIFPSIDTIEEFRIHRNSYGPEFGQAAGAQVNIVTRSGKNDFHGSVYYFGRNDKLDAFNYFLKLNPACATSTSDPSCAKNKLRRNDYGYTFGGPIKKDKIFFFWSQEWNKEIRGQVRASRVPSALEKQGNFSQSCPGQLATFNGQPALMDPTTGQPFPNNTIPQNRQSAAGLALMSAYPDPTFSNPCASPNWVASINVPQNWREESIRGDINLTKTLTLMMRYTNDSWAYGSPSAGAFWGNDPFPAIDQGWDQPSRMGVARLSKTIGTSGVNDFQFTFSDNRINIALTGNTALNQKINQSIPTLFGTGGVFDTSYNKIYGDNRPHVTFWGSALLPTLWDIAPWHNAQNLWTWQDDFSIVRGKHTFKAGILYDRDLKDEQGSQTDSGEIWGNGIGLNGNWGQTTGNDVGNFLLKNMAFGYDEQKDLFIVTNRWRDLEFYVGDNWRMTNRLTLDYGLRWSFIPNPYLDDDRYTTFNPSAFHASLGTDPCNGLLYSPDIANPCTAAGFLGGEKGPNRALMNNNNHAIAPRLGIAWDPTGHGKWAIRAGIGQFFNRDRLFSLQIAGNNPPFNASSAAGNGRFLDTLNQTGLGCSPNCYSSGAGRPNIGNDTRSQLPNSWQWNLTVERELFRDAKLEVGYVANRTMHWENRYDVNQVAPSNRLAYARLEFDTSTTAGRAALRPFGTGVGDNGITYYARNSDSIYHSLQSSFTMRFHRNSTFQAAYTFSKLISNSDRVDTPPLSADSYNFRADRGPDPLNRPHVFSANLIYHTPTLEHSNGFIRGVVGSWETGAILTMATGPSTTIRIGSVNGFGDPAGLGSSNATQAERPNRVAGQGCRANDGQRHHWFNPNAWTFDGFQLGKNGTSARGVCTGPGNNNVDFSLIKNFRITERIKAQFRMEFYNLFNHPQFLSASIPGGSDGATLGADKLHFDTCPTTTCTQAQAQAASFITSAQVNPSGLFGQASQMRDTGIREIQYALKFTF